MLDVAQLETLLRKTFNLGLEAGRGKDPVALVRLRLAKALLGVVEANALAAQSIAIERGIGAGEIAESEALAMHAAAFNGMPDPVFHLTARAMNIITGLASVEPDPRAGENDLILDAALPHRDRVARTIERHPWVERGLRVVHCHADGSCARDQPCRDRCSAAGPDGGP